MKLGPIRANLETTISLGINHTKFVYCRQETFKMGVPTPKSRLPLSSRYKFSFFSRYFHIKKCQLSIFLLLKGERHVWMTNIKVKDSFAFAEEIVHQDSKLFMGSLDVESLFTNIPLEETINICTNLLDNNEDVIEGINKSESRTSCR